MSQKSMYEDAKDKCEKRIERAMSLIEILEKNLSPLKPKKTYYGFSGLLGKYGKEFIVQNDLLDLSNKMAEICDRLNNLTLYKIGK